uniref:beta-glucosidase n=1 Tax=Albugo laibachii Nc14 TaxID=890382 RepID=F0WJC9_9STRA|nr:glycoside hydrolase putative [Albugo laibachii Nc14]|eukprot:CCA21376.1 glycoside hydrolase putative [Albugo laibachii Nc14]
MRRTLRSLCVLGAVLAGYLNCGHTSSDVDDILNGLTLDEALGQLFQLETPSVMMNGQVLNQTSLARFAKLGIGSYLNGFGTFDKNGSQENLNASEFRAIIDEIMRVGLGNQPLNPIVYGIDSVHGANYIGGATIFPQQINIAATFDVKYAYESNRMASDDTAGAGAKLIFAPVADVASNVRFPRVQETYGESAFLVSRMVAESVKGIQKSNLVAACPKHFLGYQSTQSGYDKTNADVSMFHLVNNVLKPFIAAFDVGALSMMESYSSLNAIPMVENKLWLHTVLRDVLKFEGMVLTDYKEVQSAVDFHFTSKNYSSALKRAIMAGIDMSMVVNYDDDWIGIVKQLMQEDPSFVPYVKTAISRVIRMKKKLGLYTDPYSGKELLAKVGSQESIDFAIQIARDSIVLLRNTNDTLPLNKTSKIFLSGNAFDSAGQQSGGWSHVWQGSNGNEIFSKRITILDAMKKYADKLTYTVGLNISEEYNEDEVSKAQGLAKDADVCVVALGERSGTEKPFDIDDLAMPMSQQKYLDAMKMVCKKVVLVLVQARPRTFNDSSEIGAILNTALVGPFGGQAIVEVLLGMYNPNGRQVLSYSMRDGQSIVRHDTQVDTLCNYSPCIAEYPFGHGLSYTNFTYSNLKLDARNISCTGTLTISVDVTNNGPMDGKEAVLVFLQQKVRTYVPEVKNLVEFTKIFLRVGEKTTVTFILKQEAWTYLSPDIEDMLRPVCEPSEFFVAVKYNTLCRFKGEETNEMCAKFDVV